MNCQGKINVFKKVYKVAGKDDIVSYSTTISRKEENGTYENMFLEVKFAGEKFTADKLKKLEENICYIMDVTNGFLSFRTYEKDGIKRYVPQLVILEAKLLESKQVKVDKDLW